MSVNLRILVPDSTVNYVKNPSPRYDLTGYTLVGSTITRTLDRSRFSIASVKVETAGAALHEGVFYRVSDLVGISDFITVSVYVRGAGKVRLRLINNPSGAEWFTAPFTLDDDRWHRLEISGNSTGSDDMRLYVETDNLAAAVNTFYVDGLQMERKSYATTYCDGEQEGCRWNITAYATASSRDATSRAGGRWVPLAGPCRPDNNLYVTVLGGFGMPKIDNQTQPWSNSSGSFFQNYKVQDRTLTLSFFAKKQDLTPSQPPDPVVLHELRQQLIDIIKPDKTVGGEAFLFEYSTTESDRPLYIRARYDAGLEGSWDVRNQWVNAFPLRLLCVDPFWFEDDQEVASLGIKTTASSPTSSVFSKIDNIWTEIKQPAGTKLGPAVNCFAEGPNGIIYFGGSFTTPAGISAGIAKWDGQTFSSVGPSGVGALTQIFGLAVGPDGTLYATGDFTTIGGVACNRVAKYNPVTNAWSALGTGLNGTGNSVCVAPNGQVYVGGIFTTAGGVTCQQIARWDGSQWRTVGATSGFDGNWVRVLVNAGDGRTIYVGGEFVTSNGGSVTYNRVASIDTTTNLISRLGYGVNGNVRAMTVGLDGTIYIGGDFTASSAPSAAPLSIVARYSGGQLWLPMGAGLDFSGSGAGTVIGMATGVNGQIYAVGNFDLSGVKRVPRIITWYGEVWNPSEIWYENTSGINAVFSAQNGDIFVALGSSSIPVISPATSTINNTGTAAVFPLLYYTGPGTIRYLENLKTLQLIYLDLIVLAGEEIFIDFAKGEIFSTFRGEIPYVILPGSEIRSIYLVPGDNAISALVTDDVGGVMHLRYEPQHHSADAVVDADEL